MSPIRAVEAREQPWHHARDVGRVVLTGNPRGASMMELKGSQPWLIILCHGRDRSPPTWEHPSVRYFEDFIARAGAGGLFDYWSDVSRGRMNLTGSRVLGWFRADATLAEIDAQHRATAVDTARRAATAAGVDLSGYRHTLALIEGSSHFGADGRTNAVSGVLEIVGQPGWRHCRRCETLAFWDGTRAVGPCVDGQRHDHGASSYYSVRYSGIGSTVTDGEPGWRRCTRCEAMVFSEAAARCPAGGDHAYDGVRFVISTRAAGPYEQGGWARCSRCQALAFLDGRRGPGPCPAGPTGTRHDHPTGGHAYSVPIAWSATVGGFGHETGHGFGLRHAFGALNRNTSPGEYNDWTDIMGYMGLFASPRFTPNGAGPGAPTLYKLGWVDASEARLLRGPSDSGSFKLVPLYGQAAGIRLIQSCHAAANRVHTISYRLPTGWDLGLGTPRVIVHEQRTLHSVGEDGWTWCANCQGMVRGGSWRCSAGGLHDFSGSPDYALPDASSPGQRRWRMCLDCSSLVFAGNQSLGVCPVSSAPHRLQWDTEYALPSATGSEGQAWKWCNKCQGLTYPGEAMKGTCPAGGLHDHTGSWSYLLDGADGPNRRKKWRRCKKCQGLCYAGWSRCAGGDVHVATGAGYSLTQDVPDALGESGWGYCSKCAGLAFFQAATAVGVCPAGGAHARVGGNYTLTTDSEAATAERGWYQCDNCGGAHRRDAGGETGTCVTDAPHALPRMFQQFEITRDLSSPSRPDDLRRCDKCGCIVRGSNPEGCHDGDPHRNATGTRYTVRSATGTLLEDDNSWRICGRCSILMKTTYGTEKPCSFGNGHQPTAQPLYLSRATHRTKWRRCRNCMVLALADPSQPPGPCPVGPGRRHDHTDSPYYAPPRLNEEAVMILHDNLQPGAPFTVGRTTFSVEPGADATGAWVRVTIV